MTRKGVMGLSAQLKDKLIQRSLEKKLRQSEAPRPEHYPAGTVPALSEIPEEYCRFDLHPGYQQLRIINEGAARFGRDAQRWVMSPEGKQHRLRGINARVAVPGTIAQGDTITVVRTDEPFVPALPPVSADS